jgi:phospholipid/cholesterol/gamma-HCH transport system substrate-binding protein
LLVALETFRVSSDERRETSDESGGDMLRGAFSELRVGLFISVGLVLTMVIIFMIGTESRLFGRYYSVFVNFESISGLRTGAPVQLAGLKVGHVDDIRFPEDMEERRITVQLKIHRKYQKYIRQDSVATIETEGLLGDKFIYISMGSEVQPVIPDRGVVPSKETTSIFALADKAGEVMDDIGEASAALRDMLTAIKGEKGEDDLRAAISSVRRTLEQIEKGKGLAHALIFDPRGEEAVEHLADTLKSVSDIVADAEEEAKGQLGGLIVNLRHASADLREIMGRVRRGEGTIGRFINDPSLYEELRALVGRANRSKLMRAVIRSTIQERDRQVLK